MKINRPHPRFSELSAEQHPELNRFYRNHGHKGKARPQDRAFCLREGDNIVAALRLEAHAYGWLMRGVWVDQQRRNEGLGTLLLTQCLDVFEHTPCYCFPWNHLEALYIRIGFSLKTQDAPPPLQQQLQRYQRRNQKVRLMGYHCPCD